MSADAEGRGSGRAVRNRDESWRQICFGANAAGWAYAAGRHAMKETEATHSLRFPGNWCHGRPGDT